jgi:hypothetical protein
MKYETPEITALTPAINAIQSTSGVKDILPNSMDTAFHYEGQGAYTDWE